jgi:hypothetical protein
MIHRTEEGLRKIVIVRRKPRRTQIPQTQVDHARCIERRRCNAALYDRMARILDAALGGKATKQNLMALAEKIASEKRIKIDRGAKRMKEGLICWFCENARSFISEEALPPQGFDMDENFAEAWAPREGDEFDLSSSSLLTSDLPWRLDQE